MIDQKDLDEMKLLQDAYLKKKQEMDRIQQIINKIKDIKNLNFKIKQVIDTPRGTHDDMQLIYRGCHCDGVKRGDLSFMVPHKSYVEFLTSVYFENMSIIDEMEEGLKK